VPRGPGGRARNCGRHVAKVARSRKAVGLKAFGCKFMGGILCCCNDEAESGAARFTKSRL